MTRLHGLGGALLMGGLLCCGQAARACDCGRRAVVAPSVSYYAPATAAYYAPATTAYYAPATTAYYAPATTDYYAPAATACCCSSCASHDRAALLCRQADLRAEHARRACHGAKTGRGNL